MGATCSRGLPSVSAGLLGHCPLAFLSPKDRASKSWQPVFLPSCRYQAPPGWGITCWRDWASWVRKQEPQTHMFSGWHEGGQNTQLWTKGRGGGTTWLSISGPPSLLLEDMKRGLLIKLHLYLLHLGS